MAMGFDDLTRFTLQAFASLVIDDVPPIVRSDIRDWFESHGSGCATGI
jgi:hypothetical protein